MPRKENGHVIRALASGFVKLQNAILPKQKTCYLRLAIPKTIYNLAKLLGFIVATSLWGALEIGICGVNFFSSCKILACFKNHPNLTGQSYASMLYFPF